MISSSAIAAPASHARPEPVSPSTESSISFRDVLSALNPLQYVPGVGTIYRAITGDRPPEAVRVLGSMLVGGLMGGPVGLAMSVGSAVVQHVAGIDLDQIGHDALVGLGLLEDDAPVAVVEAAPAPALEMHAGSATAAEADVGIRQVAFAAYGQVLNRAGHA